MIRLHNKSFVEYLDKCAPFNMAFADPPDAIGMKYNGFKDKFTHEEYLKLLDRIIMRSMAKADVLWLSLNARHTFLAGKVVYDAMYWLPDCEAKACVQTYTFGQHNHNDLGNNHRLLYRIKKKDAPLFPDAIRVPSWRQLNGDKRADARGRVPGDVFDFPRVTGNSKQRRSFSPTQLNEGLYERCIRLCCPPGGTVVDLFAGSGTLGRVADRCGVNGIMIELSKPTCEAIAADQGIGRIY